MSEEKKPIKSVEKKSTQLNSLIFLSQKIHMVVSQINQVQDVLQEFLTSARAELTSWIITANDPHAYNMHRMLGRVEMVEYLINQGKAAIKAKETKGKK